MKRGWPGSATCLFAFAGEDASQLLRTVGAMTSCNHLAFANLILCVVG